MKRIDELHSFNIHIACLVGIEKAILLKDLYGWCHLNLSNNKNIHSDRPWTYNSVKAFGDKYPYLKPRTIGVYLDELERDGWIESGNYNETAFDRTKWYTIDFEKYDNAILASIGKKLQMDLPETVNGDTKNCQPYHLIPSHTISTLSIPETENPKMQWGDGSEERYQKALTATLEHLKANPDKWEEVAKEARNPVNKEQFFEQLKAWLRHNADNWPIIQNPVKALTSSKSNFISWLSQPWCKDQYRTKSQPRQEPAQALTKPNFFISQRRRHE